MSYAHAPNDHNILSYSPSPNQ